jgi:C1A family cysteine protease
MLVVSSLVLGGPGTRAVFEDWKVQFGRNYTSASDEAARFAVFEQRYAEVTAHNADAETTFRQGLNHLTDRLPPELKQLRGYRWEAHPAKPASATPFHASAAALPGSATWLGSGAVSPVKQQGQGSSCWSFSAAGAIEGAFAIAVNRSNISSTVGGNGGGAQAVSLSNQQIMDCSGVDCLDSVDGTMNKAFANIVKWGGGVDTDAAYPYRDANCVTWDARCNPTMIDPRCQYWAPPHKCQANHTAVGSVTGYTHTLVGNETDLAAALLHGPVAVAMDASPSSFTSYSGGIYKSAQCGSDAASLDHAVLLVGFGTDAAKGGDYWIVKNSWGTAWGVSGFFRMARNDGNMCGLATDASYPSVKV